MSLLCTVISDGRKVSWPHVMERDGQKNVLSLCSGKGWLESVRALCMGIARKMGMEGGGCCQMMKTLKSTLRGWGLKAQFH